MKNHDKRHNTNTSSKRRSVFKKRLLATLVVLAVTTVSAGIWWGYHHEGKTVQTDQGGIELVKLSKDDLISRVTVLRVEEKAADAQKLIEYQDYYKDGSFITIMYAQVLGANDKIDIALQVLKDAEKGKEDAYFYRGHAASILAVSGRKSEAVTYYKQAIDLASAVKTEDEGLALRASTTIGDYVWSIQQLEATDA